MAYRSPARYLALVALVATTVGVVVLVNGSHSHGSHGSTSPPAQASPSTRRGAHRFSHHLYVVHRGDSLSAVSIRTGVSLDRIRQLNPRLDVNALSPGQHIKLAP